MMNPLPKDVGLIQCTIHRKKAWGQYTYILQFDDKVVYEFRNRQRMDNGLQYLMSAKKQVMSKLSDYKIARGIWDSKSKDFVHSDACAVLGKIKADFGGLNFNIYDNELNPSKVKSIQQ